MKVFISWSGEVSHKLAVCLRDWLPNVLQSVTPYVSSEDIDKGARWSKDIAQELSDSYYGILCVTKENLNAPWLNFEAGALSKSIDSSNVSPLLFDLKRAEVDGPILQFQSTILEKEDIRKLTQGINRACGESMLQEQRLDQIFEVWWPQLKHKFDEIAALPTAGATKEMPNDKHKTDKMIEEILELTRNQQRTISTQERLIHEAVRSALKGSETISAIEAGHPVFRDIEENWSELTAYCAGAEMPNSIRTDLTLILKALEGPLSFLLLRRYGTGLSTVRTSSGKRNFLSLHKD